MLVTSETAQMSEPTGEVTLMPFRVNASDTFVYAPKVTITWALVEGMRVNSDVASMFQVTSLAPSLMSSLIAMGSSKSNSTPSGE